MTDLATSTPVAQYRPNPGHSPRSRQEKYKRVHRYVRSLSEGARFEITAALSVLREAAEQLPQEDLKQAAAKQHSEDELRAATKELAALWIYLEVIDQGGEGMPHWLADFLRLALRATDYDIAEPTAESLMQAYADLLGGEAVSSRAAVSLGQRLGFGALSERLAAIFLPLFNNSQAARQAALQEALTADVMEM